MRAIVILLAGLILVVCSTAFARRPAPADAPSEDATTVAKGGNAFGLDLYAQLAAKEKGNLFFSPASIQTALAMTYAGSGGQTADQMAKTLHFTLGKDKLSPAFGELMKILNNPRKSYDDKPAYQLVIANALWGAKGYPFRPEYVKLVKANYDAGLNELDFRDEAAARKTINDWVAQQTKDKIKDLIPQGAINDMTRLILTNAIYFKSNWADKFQKTATKDGDFHVSADKTVKAAMMYQKRGFGYTETEAFQALEMPYTARDLSMVVFLPTKVDGMADFEKTLTAENLTKWLGAIKHEEVKVTFPKFKFSSQFGLAEVLKAMGMSDAFAPDRADFSGMTTMEKLVISAVIHKAFVAVDEEGTEAAAATAVMMVGTGMPVQPPQPKVFTADRPFVFLIKHRSTGAVLFMGRVVEPKAD
jgi:serpin B